MKPVARKALVTLTVIMTVTLVFMSLDRILERQRIKNQINALRNAVNRSRITADRCREGLQTSQGALLELGIVIDSLKGVIERYETIPARGASAINYQTYRLVLEEHNDSVGIWEGREQRLRTAEQACREAINDHNELADSLQHVLSEAGIITH
ncbi:MAG TPA: hypothetical protein DHW11_01420 [Gemmatimonadetes bacterium]|nr:hypothetical protein [Gemmatimonadota bacterium]HCW78202.1 hypothetical protein [Gemmatimonadota bacterium]|tara:strand:+ start:567 stop:1028 length:462 start_codon:yes stop_codon:yes gene_type:complete